MLDATQGVKRVSFAVVYVHQLGALECVEEYAPAIVNAHLEVGRRRRVQHHLLGLQVNRDLVLQVQAQDVQRIAGTDVPQPGIGCVGEVEPAQKAVVEPVLLARVVSAPGPVIGIAEVLRVGIVCRRVDHVIRVHEMGPDAHHPQFRHHHVAVALSHVVPEGQPGDVEELGVPRLRSEFAAAAGFKVAGVDAGQDSQRRKALS